MKPRPTTLDLLASEFAAAVAEGDLEKAEGWLATAALVTDRLQDRLPDGLLASPA